MCRSLHTTEAALTYQGRNQRPLNVSCGMQHKDICYISLSSVSCINKLDKINAGILKCVFFMQFKNLERKHCVKELLRLLIMCLSIETVLEIHFIYIYIIYLQTALPQHFRYFRQCLTWGIYKSSFAGLHSQLLVVWWPW